MGRPCGTKNNMRTSEEKEKILKEFYLRKIGRNEICKKYNISTSVFKKWRDNYEINGLEGLKSNAGKACKNNKYLGIHLRKPKNKMEELELEILKKDIEIARLKKGYLMKGVGQEKEFVITFDKNTK